MSKLHDTTSRLSPRFSIGEAAMAEGDGQRRIRFGLVGCGRIGATGDQRAAQWPTANLWLPYAHASAIAACDCAELRAVCDVNESSAQATAQLYSARRSYTDYRAMLACESLDGLAVATRTAERPAIIEEAIKQGTRGLYCEKPLCNSLETADRLRGLVEGRGVCFSYGVKRRFMPVHQQTRARVRAGEIGDLQSITLRLGNGLLLWTQPHAVDMACYYAGDSEVAWVQADLDLDPAAIRGNVVDADPLLRMAYIRFASGVVAHIIPGDSYDVELAGSRGLLCVRNDGLDCQSRCSHGAATDAGAFLEEKRTPTWEKSSGTLNSIRLLALAIRDGSFPGYDVSLAVRNLEILFACVHSHLEGGRRIAFPLERRGLVITGRSGELLT
jgi:predicted dehydrogenase